MKDLAYLAAHYFRLAAEESVAESKYRYGIWLLSRYSRHRDIAGVIGPQTMAVQMINLPLPGWQRMPSDYSIPSILAPQSDVTSVAVIALPLVPPALAGVCRPGAAFR
jgi:hypothetical protein